MRSGRAAMLPKSSVKNDSMTSIVMLMVSLFACSYIAGRYASLEPYAPGFARRCAALRKRVVLARCKIYAPCPNRSPSPLVTIALGGGGWGFKITVVQSVVSVG